MFYLEQVHFWANAMSKSKFSIKNGKPLSTLVSNSMLISGYAIVSSKFGKSGTCHHITFQSVGKVVAKGEERWLCQNVEQPCHLLAD